MARPIFTSNSPSAGYVAWTSFGIRYGGVERVIAAGNTNLKYAYWLWNNGSPATTLTLSNTLPALQDEDLLILVNRGGTAIDIQNTNVVDGSLIVTGSIVGDHIAANSIDATKVVADSLTAREIAAGAITATELSISAVGPYQAVNGDMEDLDQANPLLPAGWTAGFERTGAPTYSQETTSPLSGSRSTRIAVPSGGVEVMASRATPVAPGDKIVMGVAFRSLTRVNVPYTLRAYFGAIDGFTAAGKITTVPAVPTNVEIFEVTAAGLVPVNNIPTPVSGAGIAALVEGWPAPEINKTYFITGQIIVPAGAKYIRFGLGSGLTTFTTGAHATLWDSLEYASVISRTRIGDGAVTTKKLEAELVLSTTIVAGNPLGIHTKIQPQGIRVFDIDGNNDGLPDEVIRMGTDTNDFLGINDSSGQQVLNLDDTGSVNARTANFREDVTIMGTKLSKLIENSANHQYAYVQNGGINSVSGEVGLLAADFDINPDHMYWIAPEVSWTRQNNEAELNLIVRDFGVGGNPVVGQGEVVYNRQFSNVLNNGYGAVASSPGLYQRGTPGTPTVKRRLLLSVLRGGAGLVNINNTFPQTLTLIDLGPAKPILGSVNRAGGGATPPPPPTQQYQWEAGGSGLQNFKGSGAAVSFPDRLYQGYDPSGSNGDMRSYIWWSLPSITGTVDRVDLYLYFDHWYYNSGGTAVINCAAAFGGASFPPQLRQSWFVGGWPKPGGRWVTLPSDWWQLFKNGGGANTITLGPSGGSNLNYYGRAIGSATRLKIWYTQ